jgi:hypothetical protein
MHNLHRIVCCKPVRQQTVFKRLHSAEKVEGRLDSQRTLQPALNYNPRAAPPLQHGKDVAERLGMGLALTCWSGRADASQLLATEALTTQPLRMTTQYEAETKQMGCHLKQHRLA